nr:response regulator [Salinicola tamaricis]
MPRPDLLVVDYHLDAADDDGLAVAEQLQRERPGLPVLMVTANHDAALKARIRERGYAYLLKPVKPLRLKMLLVSLLGLAA